MAVRFSFCPFSKNFENLKYFKVFLRFLFYSVIEKNSIESVIFQIESEK